jgi:hypothetical protein
LYIAVHLIGSATRKQQAENKMSKSEKMQVRTLGVVNVPQGKSYVPGVRIAGKYLLNLGFKLGDTVEVTPNGDGSLNIRRVEPCK